MSWTDQSPEFYEYAGYDPWGTYTTTRYDTSYEVNEELGRQGLREIGFPDRYIDMFFNSELRDSAIEYGLTGNKAKWSVAFSLYQAERASRSGSGGGGGITKEQQRQQLAAEFKNFAGQFGVSDYADWDSIAQEAANNNWSAAMVRDLVASYINADSLNRAGYVRDIYDKTMATGSQYFVKFNAEEVLGYAKQIAAEDLNEESLLGIIKQRAKAQYSWLSDVIDSGTSLKEYFKPHRDAIANLLEMSPEAINFMDDPKWQKVVQRPPDGKDNAPRSMSIFETEQYVRGLDEWKATNNARTNAATMVGALGQIMGSI